MDVSIVVPSFNKIDFLKRALRSLDRLSYPRENFEVIVVDDGSKDSTREFLENFIPSFQFRFIRHEVNRGLSAARNTGLKNAQGTIIVSIDDDMEVIPHFIEEHIAFHTTGRKVAVMGNVQLAPEVLRTGIVRYLSTRGVHKLHEGQKMPFKYLIFNNASIQKSTLFEAGLFDEKIRVYGGEDLELTFRLEQLGDVEFLYAPNAISFHMHYRHIDEVCRLMFDYGQTSLAYMIHKHPQLAETVKAHFIEPVKFGRDTIPLICKKILFQAVMNPFFLRILKWYGTYSPTGRPSLIYDYIIASSYLSGLKKSRTG